MIEIMWHQKKADLSRNVESFKSFASRFESPPPTPPNDVARILMPERVDLPAA
jgi:hypothetical protein